MYKKKKTKKEKNGPVQPSWETMCALHALLSNINDGPYLVGRPHMLKTCLRRPQPMYTMVGLFEYDVLCRAKEKSRKSIFFDFEIFDDSDLFFDEESIFQIEIVVSLF